MRPLVIDQAVRTRIAEVKDYAHAHIMSLAQLMNAMGKEELAVGYNPKYRLIIPFGYRVVYSEEMQVPGLCAHFSVSVDSVGEGALFSLPHELGVVEIMKEFGVTTPIKEVLHIWTEEIADGGKAAINVLVKIEPSEQERIF